MPFITQHITEFSSLGIPWSWSIVHGIADPVADTSWCQRLSDMPDDGTLPYLQELVKEFPGQVHVQSAVRWPGKTAMCNAALQAFTEPGILLEVDVDEFWSTAQLEVLPNLFEAYPQFDHAYFLCRYFVGPRRVLTQPDSYANHTSYEWLRAWHWAPGRRFLKHESPVMEGQRRDRAMGHLQTANAGLIFDHHAWTTEEQVGFKSRYYGYGGAVEGWKRLLAQTGPQELTNFFPWVKDWTHGQPCMTYEIPGGEA